MTARFPAVLTALAVLGVGVGVPDVAAAVPPSSVPAQGDAADQAGEQEEEQEPLSLLLDDVDPAVAEPGEEVRLTGRILNSGSTARRSSSLTAAVSPVPLASRAEIGAWVDGDPVREATTVVGDDTVGPLVPAGGAVPFDITVPASVTESFPAGPGALALELTAGAQGDDRAQSSGTVVLRTLLTSAGTLEVGEPLDVAWLVPLTLPADAGLSSPDAEVNARAWMAATGSDSVIAGWLEQLEIPEVTYVVDPAALVPRRPTPGVATPLGSADPGGDGEGSDEPGDNEGSDEPEGTGDAGDDAATTTGPTPSDEAGATATDDPAQTLEPNEPAEEQDAPTDVDVAARQAELRSELTALGQDRLWWLPADDPDLEVLLGRPSGTDTAELLAASPTDPPEEVDRLLGRGRGDLAWPATTGTTTEQLGVLAGLYADRPDGGPLGVTLLPREAFTADSAAGPHRGAIPLQEPEGVTALGVDSWTSALVADGQRSAEEHGAGAAAQHLLAHTLGTYQEDPGVQRELVIAPPRGTTAPAEVLQQVSEGWRLASWLTPVSAQDLLERAEGTEPLVPTPTPPQESVLGPLAALLEPADSPVTSSRAAALVRIDEDLAGLRQVLRDTDPLQSWEPVLEGLWSTRWRGDEVAWEQAYRDLREDVAAANAGVHVTASTVNFLTDQGAINVTVVNDLGVAVDDVTLELEASNGRLQVTRQPDPVSIGPGSRASVSFDARAITRGETTLTARILTPDGTVLGSEAAIDVRMQPAGLWIYWVLGGLAGLVLVLGLARALRSGPRSRSAKTSATATSSSGPPTPTPTPPTQAPTTDTRDQENPS
ncbi:DUF6049 family protein [Ornithinimicrobium sp. LYQ92]|uniref:DUF6049 family protein n=1 Tax=Serinicoccus sp. LYQ92 TaxID=3378798 RepID=UPI0038544821